MRLSDAEALAAELLEQHGLKHWRFRFDNARTRFGSCHYTRSEITLSRRLTELNDPAMVREVLLHEIAHALTPGANHGPRWRRQCQALDIPATRCYRAESVTQPPARYLLRCDTCGLELRRYRKSRRLVACKRCCDCYNGGAFSPAYRLRWLPAPP
jgi:predicted SprT family Zn-dependent metalloprotease